MTALPQWVRPQLTQLVDAAPEGDQWLHEIKYDGYRMHARLDRGAVKLLTRTGLDWTHKYPAIAEDVASLDARHAYLDGELCGVGPTALLRSASSNWRPTAGTPPLSSSFCSIFSTSTAKIYARGP
jgi:ATP-dependent DNA ligase